METHVSMINLNIISVTTLVCALVNTLPTSSIESVSTRQSIGIVCISNSLNCQNYIIFRKQGGGRDKSMVKKKAFDRLNT